MTIAAVRTFLFILFGIVCAASAPSEGTALNGQKNNETNTFCNFDGGERNIAEISFPSVYNVVRRNYSDSAKPGTTFFYDYFIKQYQNSKSNSCSIMEGIPSEENKNLHSDFTYRKRKLLWTTDEKKFKPKTLRPPVRGDGESTSNPPPGKETAGMHLKDKVAALSQEIKTAFKEKTKFLRPRKKKVEDTFKMESCDLSCKEKKMLLSLTRFKEKGKKKKLQSSHLDMLKVDDDLDLNKRIKKLVEQLAEENHRKKEVVEEGKTRGMRESEGDDKSINNEKELLPMFNNTKKTFRFNESNHNNNNNRTVDVVNTVPVSNTRGGDPVSEKAENAVSSYDVLKKTGKTLRFRRNPHNSHNSYEITGKNDKKYSIARSNPYSANVKANVNSFNPRRSRKFFDENAKKRWMRATMRKCKRKKRVRDWPIVRKVLRKLSSRCRNPNFRCRCKNPNRKAGKASSKSTKARPFFNNTGVYRDFPVRGDTAKLIPEAWREVDELLKTSRLRGHEFGRTTTEDLGAIFEIRAGVIPSQSIEKPLLERRLGEDKFKVVKGLDYKYVTEYPSTSLLDLQSSNGTSDGINIFRYLRIRHILRNNIDHNRVEDPKMMRYLYKRTKRHGSKIASVCKNQRSAPLLCIPYIRKGQEEQLRYIIKVIQNMMGKPLPPNSEIFEKIKFRPSGEVPYIPRGFHWGEDRSNYPLNLLPYQCGFPYPDSKFFQPFQPRPYVMASSVTYEPTRQATARVAPTEPLKSGAFTTLPSVTQFSTNLSPLKGTSPTKSAPTTLPISFPILSKSLTKHAKHSEKDIIQESLSSTVAPTEPSSSSSPAPTHPSTVKAKVALQGKNPVQTDATVSTSSPVHVAPTASSPAPVAPTTSSTVHVAPTTSSPVHVAPTTSTTSSTDIFYDEDTSPPSSVSVPSTASTPGQRIDPSTVNSYVLQETEIKIEREGTSGTTTNKGEEGTTMISHFSGAPTQESTAKQGLMEEQNPAEGDACEVQRAQQPHSEFVGSRYPVPRSNEDFKNLEPYNSEKLSRDSLSRNEENCRKLDVMQNVLGNEQRRASFHDKHGRRFKKRNSKASSKNDKPNSVWLKHIKEGYLDMLERSGLYHPKMGNPENRVKYSKAHKYSIKAIQPPYCQQRVVGPVTKVPLDIGMDYMPPYKYQSPKLKEQSSGNSQQQKSDHLLPLFGVFHKGRVTYDVSPPPEQNAGKYIALGNYEVEPTEEGRFLKRSKRADDYYVWSDTDYSDYFDDANHLDENQSSVKDENPGNDQSLKETATPPSYDMFSELAKAIVQTEAEKTGDTDESDNSRGREPESNKNSSRTGGPTEPSQPNSGSSESPGTEDSTTVTGKTKSKTKEKKPRERIPKFSGVSKTLIDSREDKVGQSDEYLAPEDGHGPTTLKSAVIVRGQKKAQGKPSPKVYTKVFPDSFESDHESGESTTSTTGKTTEVVNMVKPTEQGPLSTKTDLRVKILAVCEGYLEVVKLIKAQNQTLGEDLDENLARYCENIISQNFNFQSEKPKRSEKLEKLSEDLISAYNSRSLPEEGFGGGLNLQGSDDLISKGEPRLTGSPLKIASRERRKFWKKFSPKTKTLPLSKSNTRRRRRPRRKIRRKKEAEQDLEGKGVTAEQKQLIRLLRERKKALLSWLLNTKDDVKPDDLQETEYFDEEDLMDPEGDTSQYSGTVKPRRDETYETTKKNMSLTKKTIFPVYAKEYGYDSGGELIEVDILWRQVNEKTHENKIFKNLSVLALLMTSTHAPKIKQEDTKLAGDSNEFAEGGWSNKKIKKKKLSFGTARVDAEGDISTTTSEVLEESIQSPANLASPIKKKTDKISKKSSRKNRTHTIISKPDPKTIVGAPTSANKTHRKISHKYGVAKDIFQEYSIEFLNYAVYILPMMFTILFLLCCLCCALQILKIQKCHKKRKKKKKSVSSEETSDTGTSESESKKRKREAKRKRNPGSKENYEDNVHKKKSKTFWNYLRAYGKTAREMEEENNQTDKKKSFLGFLRTKRDECKPQYSSAPTHETDEEPRDYPDCRERRHYSDQYLTCRTNRREEEKHKCDEQSENTERRELIALLEELKKIETEHIGAKKEVKSVHVQYVTPEYENTAFSPDSRVPAFSYPYEKNVFGMPKGVSPFYNKKFQFHPNYPPPPRDYKLYEGVNELTELLPWTCYTQQNDLLRRSDFNINQTGRCDGFVKIFRDSGMRCNKQPIIEKNCKKSESENRSFIFNKYKSISMDRSEELRGVTGQISGAEVRLMENVSPYKLSSNRDEDLVEDVENLKCHLNKKVRLKDEGVLCRL